MSDHTTPEEPAESRLVLPESPEQAKARERAIASMVTASFLAVLGTLIFAWALRATDYPWLFAVGALPWTVGVIVFASALVKYNRS